MKYFNDPETTIINTDFMISLDDSSDNLSYLGDIKDKNTAKLISTCEIDPINLTLFDI